MAIPCPAPAPRYLVDPSGKQPPQALPSLIEMHRLSTESYAKLAAKMPPIYVDAETTALQASFQLGVQHVLKQLREGWVVG